VKPASYRRLIKEERKRGRVSQGRGIKRKSQGGCVHIRHVGRSQEKNIHCSVTTKDTQTQGKRGKYRVEGWGYTVWQGWVEHTAIGGVEGKKGGEKKPNDTGKPGRQKERGGEGESGTDSGVGATRKVGRRP